MWFREALGGRRHAGGGLEAGAFAPMADDAVAGLDGGDAFTNFLDYGSGFVAEEVGEEALRSKGLPVRFSCSEACTVEAPPSR